MVWSLLIAQSFTSCVLFSKSVRFRFINSSTHQLINSSTHQLTTLSLPPSLPPSAPLFLQHSLTHSPTPSPPPPLQAWTPGIILYLTVPYYLYRYICSVKAEFGSGSAWSVPLGEAAKVGWCSLTVSKTRVESAYGFSA